MISNEDQRTCPSPSEALSRLDGVSLREVQADASSTGTTYEIEYLTECASTNLALMARARQGAPHALVLGCELQRAGRGRRGRTWVSSPGASLTFSLLWRFTEQPVALQCLGLVVAASIARALESLGTPHLMLKWPNDIYFDYRKLGGILIESLSGASGAPAVVVGIGLNVRVPLETREKLDHPIADLNEAGYQGNRAMLLGRILRYLAEDIPRCAERGFAPFKEQWHARELMRGERVVLTNEGGVRHEGQLLGIGEDGSLQLRCDEGIREFRSGELSLRRA